MGEHESTVVGVRLPAAIAAALEAHCQRTGAKPSEVIREAVRRHLKLPAEAAAVKAGRPWAKERDAH